MSSNFRGRRATCAARAAWLGSALVLAPAARAHTPGDPTQTLPEVVISGHYDNAVGTSNAASQGTINSKLLVTRPALRPGEVLEFIPGMIVTQHSGDGKANQYFLRGFNLDHGTDFATFIAGMPVNLPTHAHGHGYTDLNFLIPELIDRIEYRKGPYFAANGDFSSVGSAQIDLRRSLAAGFGQATIGPNGYRRMLAADSLVLGNGGRLLAALELQAGDGPWENPQNLRKHNAVLSYSAGTRADGFAVTLMGYQSRWNSTDQVPLRAIESGLIGRFGAIDPTSGGDTSRTSVSGEWRRPLEDGSMKASAYAIRYRLGLYSNFTYALDNPVDGDQFLQRDSRSVFGGQLARVWYSRLGSLPMTTELGLQTRFDRIQVGLFDTVAREVTATTRDDRVRQGSVGFYAENGITWTDWLRTVAGLRVDRLQWQVASNLAANSGSESASQVSPKFSAILGPWHKTEMFLNWGQGFHSNDGRGTTIRVDPSTGDPTPRVTGLARTTGYEIGLRSEPVRGLQSSLAIWRLTIGSELLFVGDAGATEAGRPSQRQGVEWSNRYIATPWLLFDADLALSQARFTDGDPAGNRVPGSVAKVGSVAVTVRDLAHWSASLQARFLGARPLTEDGAQMAASTTLVNARVGYRVNRQAELSFDLFNLFNRRVNDIEYFYASRLRGEAAPVDDRHVHPAEARALRVTLRLTI